MFDSSTFVVTDKLAEIIDVALTDGVSTLPMLPKENGGEAKLTNSLRQVYFRNVDILENYLQSNIFTIRSMPPTRRRKIVEAFLSNQHKDDQDSSSSSSTAAVLADVTNEQQQQQEKEETSIVRYPRKEEIPSLKDLTKVEQGLVELRHKLRQCKVRRNELRGRLERLAKADQSIKSVQESLKEVSTSEIHKSVTTMVEGKEGLEELTQDAKKASERLDRAKDERREEDKENEKLIAAKKPRLTLEEAFEQDRKSLKATTEDLLAVANRL